MSRRKSDADQEFGSDSFLDIIANIVGILIILIVVAGVKVARQAETRDPVAVQLSQNPDLVAEAVSDEALASQTDVTETAWPWKADEDQQTPTVEPEFSEDELQQIRVELALLEAEAAELRNEIATLDQQQKTQDDERNEADLKLADLQTVLDDRTADDSQARMQLTTLKQDRSETENRLADLKAILVSKQDRQDLYAGTLGTLEQRQRYVRDALEQVSQETRRLRELLESHQHDTEVADLLNHRLAPVGRPVAEDELHFRLSGGRIAHVPLEELLVRLKTQMKNRLGLVAKFQRYNGSVGPVQGFRMEYLVERQPLPPMQALQYGRAPYQLSVSRWQIHSTQSLVAETVEESLQLGSRFRQILERTYPETAITIWLYPEDFQHFHRLRQFAHQLDLRVAARPLPKGFPITASPSGSRSTSQ